MTNEELAKEAYILVNQLEAFEKVLVDGNNISGYKAVAESYNKMLHRAKELMKIDGTFLGSINHLCNYDPNLEYGYASEYTQIRVSVPVLKGALHTFCSYYLPANEKEKIGFRA